MASKRLQKPFGYYLLKTHSPQAERSRAILQRRGFVLPFWNVQNISAKKAQEKENARVFGSPSRARRASRTAKAPRQRQTSTCSVGRVMLARKFRLPREAFKTVGKGGKITTHYFVIKFAANTIERNRFAVVIPAAAEKRSTRRHALKRRLLDGVRTWPNFGKDVLMLVARAAFSAPAKEIAAELKGAALKISRANQ